MYRSQFARLRTENANAELDHDYRQRSRQYCATVYHHPWTNHGRQKNIALSHVTGDWVLLLDADERVAPALAAEIRKATEDSDAAGFEIPRLSFFCGRWMRHSGWYPDYVLRLFRRERGRFSDHLVHTRVICDGKVKRLAIPLTHFAVRRIQDLIAKMEFIRQRALRKPSRRENH